MEQKTAIVTGGSRGLGRALAGALAESGWTVIIDGRHVESLSGVAGAGLVGVTGDINDPAHRSALVEEAKKTGRLDLLVNNASTLGPSPLPPLSSYPLSDLEAVLATNVVSPLALVQMALPLLRDSRGAVINVTSDAGVEAYPGWGGYGSSKAALEQLSAVLAAEEPDLRIWSFDPGDMRTQMHQDAFPGEDISDRPEPETVVPAVLRLLADQPPSGRLKAADLLAGAAK